MARNLNNGPRQKAWSATAPRLLRRLAMNADAFRSYGEVLAELRRLMAERRTGTLFIATVDNEGGQLGLRDGGIVSIRFRRKSGMEAAYGVRNIAGARFTFTPDFLLAPADPLLSSDAVLAVLTDGRST